MRIKILPSVLGIFALTMTLPTVRNPSRAGAQSSFSVADLRAAITKARPNSRVNIPAGIYNIGSTPLRIEDKRNVQIIGAGAGKTIIRSAASAPFIFEIAGSNDRLTVASMSLEGAVHLAKNTHALASGSDRMNLTRARFHDLDIRNVAVGISVVGSGNGICDDVQITANHLDNIQDFFTAPNHTSGSGYGIHNDGCSNVRIADNVIRNADRHSIYQASAYQPDRPKASGSIIIDHNVIIDHAKTSSLNNDWLVAIVVARSSNVVVSRNVIVNPYHDAISIEDPPGEGRHYTVKNVSLIDNTVRGSRAADVFLTASGTFTSEGNHFYHSSATGTPSSPFIRRDGKGMSGRLTSEGR
ncbi:MAG: hypothetical protein ABR582_01945 [Gemmatimonadaceae bacterium]